MRYKLLIIITISLITGCEKKPHSRTFPIITTENPIHTDQTGATFRGELLQNGDMSITSYGFVWSTVEPNIDLSCKVEITGPIKPGIFKIRIDSELARGVEYKIKAFAKYSEYKIQASSTYSDKIVYGNTISFTSKGSSKSAWSLEVNKLSLRENYGASCGNSDNNTGFIIFASSHTYVYDPVNNLLTRSVDLPISNNSFFTSVFISNIPYFFSYINNSLYKLDAGAWTVQSKTPFNYADFGGFYLGFSAFDKLYLLSSFKSYMFSPETSIWQTRAILPTGTGSSRGGTIAGNKAYAVTSGKTVWEYNIITDQWVRKTTYPGNIPADGFVVSFAYNNKLYFGLGYPKYYSSVDQNLLSNMDRRLWSYDPELDKWTALEGFPATLTSGGLFYFFLKNELYVGNNDSGGNISIWKYDPSK